MKIVARIVAILIALVMILGLVIPVFASTTQTNFISDLAGLFTDQQVDELHEKAHALVRRHNIDVIILTSDDPSIRNSLQYADDFYTRAGSGNGVMLYIGMAQRDVYFLTFGAWVPVFNNYIDFVLDPVTPLLSDGDYVGAVEAFLDAVNMRILLSSYMPVQPPQTGHDIASLIGQSLIFGLCASGLALLVLVLIHGRSLPSPPCYRTYLGGSVQTRNQIDRFLRTHTSRIAIPKNTSSGGMGGRGGGMGGRGGGGRKF